MRYSLGFLLFLAGSHVLAAPTLRLSNSVTALTSHSHSLLLSKRGQSYSSCSQKAAKFIKSHPAETAVLGGVCTYYISRQANYDAAIMVNKEFSSCEKEIEALRDEINAAKREMEQLKSKVKAPTSAPTAESNAKRSIMMEWACQTYRTMVKPSDKPS